MRANTMMAPAILFLLSFLMLFCTSAVNASPMSIYNYYCAKFATSSTYLPSTVTQVSSASSPYQCACNCNSAKSSAYPTGMKAYSLQGGTCYCSAYNAALNTVWGSTSQVDFSDCSVPCSTYPIACGSTKSTSQSGIQQKLGMVIELHPSSDADALCSMNSVQQEFAMWKFYAAHSQPNLRYSNEYNPSNFKMAPSIIGVNFCAAPAGKVNVTLNFESYDIQVSISIGNVGFGSAYSSASYTNIRNLQVAFLVPEDATDVVTWAVQSEGPNYAYLYWNDRVTGTFNLTDFILANPVSPTLQILGPARQQGAMQYSVYNGYQGGRVTTFSSSVIVNHSTVTVSYPSLPFLTSTSWVSDDYTITLPLGEFKLGFDDTRTCGQTIAVRNYVSPGYLGSFYLNPYTEDTMTYLFSSSSMYWGICQEACGLAYNYTYAGVYNTNDCYCGNKFGSNGIVTNKPILVQATCGGGPYSNLGCGSPAFIDVYRSYEFYGCFAANDTVSSQTTFDPTMYFKLQNYLGEYSYYTFSNFLNFVQIDDNLCDARCANPDPYPGEYPCGRQDNATVFSVYALSPQGNIDECADSNPCGSFGVCVDNPISFTCIGVQDALRDTMYPEINYITLVTKDFGSQFIGMGSGASSGTVSQFNGLNTTITRVDSFDFSDDFTYSYVDGYYGNSTTFTIPANSSLGLPTYWSVGNSGACVGDLGSATIFIKPVMIYYYNSVYNLGGAPSYTANANGVAYAFSANTYNVTIPGPPGNISYTISDGYGNIIPATATIPVPIATSALAVTFDYFDVTCLNATVQVTVSGGVPFAVVGQEYQLTLDGGSNNITGNSVNFTGVSVASHTLSVLDAAGCQKQFPFTVISRVFTATFEFSVMNASCYGGSDGSISVTVGGMLLPLQYTWDYTLTGESNAFNTTTAGYHQLDVVDAGGCMATSGIDVYQPTQLSATFNSSLFCGHQVTVALLASGGTPPYTYIVTDVANASNVYTRTAPSDATIAVADGHTYHVSVTDFMSCSYAVSSFNDTGRPSTLPNAVSATVNFIGSSIVVTWGVPAPNPIPTSSYLLTYTPYSILANTVAGTTNSISLNANTQNGSFSATYGYKYLIGVQAYNCYGASASSTTWATFAVVPGAPQGLFATSLAPNTTNAFLSVQWQAPASIPPLGDTLMYILSYQVQSTSSWNTLSASSSRSALLVVTPNTYYSIQVQTVNLPGQTSTYSSTTVLAIGYPEAPSAPEFGALSSPSGIRTMNFTSSPTVSQQTVAHILQYQTNTGGATTWTNITLTGNSNVPISLPTGWTYFTRIIARSTGGETIGPTINVTFYLAPTPPVLDGTQLGVSWTSANISLKWNYTGPTPGGLIFTVYSASQYMPTLSSYVALANTTASSLVVPTTSGDYISFYVSASSLGGQASSNVLTFFPEMLPLVTDLQFLNVTGCETSGSFCTLEFSAVVSSLSPISAYWMNISVNGTEEQQFSISPWSSSYINKTSTFYGFRYQSIQYGLPVGFRIQAQNQLGQGPFTPPILTWTEVLPAAPEPPRVTIWYNYYTSLLCMFVGYTPRSMMDLTITTMELYITSPNGTTSPVPIDMASSSVVYYYPNPPSASSYLNFTYVIGNKVGKVSSAVTPVYVQITPSAPTGIMYDTVSANNTPGIHVSWTPVPYVSNYSVVFYQTFVKNWYQEFYFNPLFTLYANTSSFTLSAQESSDLAALYGTYIGAIEVRGISSIGDQGEQGHIVNIPFLMPVPLDEKLQQPNATVLDNGRMQVTWAPLDPATQFSGPDAIIVWRWYAQSSLWYQSWSGTSSSTSTSIIFEYDAHQSGVSYQFWVVAVNTNTGPLPNVASLPSLRSIPLVGPAVPAAPAALISIDSFLYIGPATTTCPSCATVKFNVKWRCSTSDPTITSYQLTVTSNNLPRTFTIPFNQSMLNVTDLGMCTYQATANVSAAVPIYGYVQASNMYGTSYQSPSISATVVTAPGKFVPGSFGGTYDRYHYTCTLSPYFAIPGFIGGSVDYFILERANSPSIIYYDVGVTYPPVPTSPSAWTVLQNVSLLGTTLTPGWALPPVVDYDARCDTPYYYRVTGYNKLGAGATSDGDFAIYPTSGQTISSRLGVTPSFEYDNVSDTYYGTVNISFQGLGYYPWTSYYLKFYYLAGWWSDADQAYARNNCPGVWGACSMYYFYLTVDATPNNTRNGITTYQYKFTEGAIITGITVACTWVYNCPQYSWGSYYIGPNPNNGTMSLANYKVVKDPITDTFVNVEYTFSINHDCNHMVKGIEIQAKINGNWQAILTSSLKSYFSVEYYAHHVAASSCASLKSPYILTWKTPIATAVEVRLCTTSNFGSSCNSNMTLHPDFPQWWYYPAPPVVFLDVIDPPLEAITVNSTDVTIEMSWMLGDWTDVPPVESCLISFPEGPNPPTVRNYGTPNVTNYALPTHTSRPPPSGSMVSVQYVVPKAGVYFTVFPTTNTKTNNFQSKLVSTSIFGNQFIICRKPPSLNVSTATITNGLSSTYVDPRTFYFYMHILPWVYDDCPLPYLNVTTTVTQYWNLDSRGRPMVKNTTQLIRLDNSIGAKTFGPANFNPSYGQYSPDTSLEVWASPWGNIGAETYTIQFALLNPMPGLGNLTYVNNWDNSFGQVVDNYTFYLPNPSFAATNPTSLTKTTVYGGPYIRFSGTGMNAGLPKAQVRFRAATGTVHFLVPSLKPADWFSYLVKIPAWPDATLNSISQWYLSFTTDGVRWAPEITIDVSPQPYLVAPIPVWYLANSPGNGYVFQSNYLGYCASSWVQVGSQTGYPSSVTVVSPGSTVVNALTAVPVGNTAILTYNLTWWCDGTNFTTFVVAYFDQSLITSRGQGYYQFNYDKVGDQRFNLTGSINNYYPVRQILPNPKLRFTPINPAVKSVFYSATTWVNSMLTFTDSPLPTFNTTSLNFYTLDITWDGSHYISVGLQSVQVFPGAPGPATQNIPNVCMQLACDKCSGSCTWYSLESYVGWCIPTPLPSYNDPYSAQPLHDCAGYRVFTTINPYPIQADYDGISIITAKFSLNYEVHTLALANYGKEYPINSNFQIDGGWYTGNPIQTVRPTGGYSYSYIMNYVQTTTFANELTYGLTNFQFPSSANSSGAPFTATVSYSYNSGAQNIWYTLSSTVYILALGNIWCTNNGGGTVFLLQGLKYDSYQAGYAPNINMYAEFQWGIVGLFTVGSATVRIKGGPTVYTISSPKGKFTFDHHNYDLTPGINWLQLFLDDRMVASASFYVVGLPTWFQKMTNFMGDDFGGPTLYGQTAEVANGWGRVAGFPPATLMNELHLNDLEAALSAFPDRGGFPITGYLYGGYDLSGMLMMGGGLDLQLSFGEKEAGHSAKDAGKKQGAAMGNKVGQQQPSSPSGSMANTSPLDIEGSFSLDVKASSVVDSKNQVNLMLNSIEMQLKWIISIQLAGASFGFSSYARIALGIWLDFEIKGDFTVYDETINDAGLELVDGFVMTGPLHFGAGPRVELSVTLGPLSFGIACKGQIVFDMDFGLVHGSPPYLKDLGWQLDAKGYLKFFTWVIFDSSFVTITCKLDFPASTGGSYGTSCDVYAIWEHLQDVIENILAVAVKAVVGFIVDVGKSLFGLRNALPAYENDFGSCHLDLFPTINGKVGWGYECHDQIVPHDIRHATRSPVAPGTLIADQSGSLMLGAAPSWGTMGIQLAVAPNGAMLALWKGLDYTLPPPYYETIMYSFFSNETQSWSPASFINNVTYIAHDFKVEAFVDTDLCYKFIAVWQQMFFENNTAYSVVNGSATSEIIAAIFDPTAELWASPQLVTNDGVVMDAVPALCIQAQEGGADAVGIVWAHAGSPNFWNGTNEILYAKYANHKLSAPQVVASNLGPVYEASCTYAGYSLGVAYISSDYDGDAGAKIVFFDGTTSTTPVMLTQGTSAAGDGLVDNDVQLVAFPAEFVVMWRHNSSTMFVKKFAQSGSSTWNTQLVIGDSNAGRFDQFEMSIVGSWLIISYQETFSSSIFYITTMQEGSNTFNTPTLMYDNGDNMETAVSVASILIADNPDEPLAVFVYTNKISARNESTNTTYELRYDNNYIFRRLKANLSISTVDVETMAGGTSLYITLSLYNDGPLATQEGQYVLNLWEGSFDATSSTPIFSQAVPVVAPTTTFIFYGTFTPSASWGGYAWVEVTYAASGVVTNVQRYQLFTPTVEETQVLSSPEGVLGLGLVITVDSGFPMGDVIVPTSLYTYNDSASLPTLISSQNLTIYSAIGGATLQYSVHEDEIISNLVVLIGNRAQSIGDSFASPFSPLALQSFQVMREPNLVLDVASIQIYNPSTNLAPTLSVTVANENLISARNFTIEVFLDRGGLDKNNVLINGPLLGQVTVPILTANTQITLNVTLNTTRLAVAGNYTFNVFVNRLLTPQETVYADNYAQFVCSIVSDSALTIYGIALSSDGSTVSVGVFNVAPVTLVNGTVQVFMLYTNTTQVLLGEIMFGALPSTFCSVGLLTLPSNASLGNDTSLFVRYDANTNYTSDVISALGYSLTECNNASSLLAATMALDGLTDQTLFGGQTYLIEIGADGVLPSQEAAVSFDVAIGTLHGASTANYTFSGLQLLLALSPAALAAGATDYMQVNVTLNQHVANAETGELETKAITSRNALYTIISCTPKTCFDIGATCGPVSDGCGSTLSCESCTGGDLCINGTCKCIPKTCTEQNYGCGLLDDGCGTIVGCGSCIHGESCNISYQCAADPCITNTAGCSRFATCNLSSIDNNRFDGFNCSCNSGYSGDGFACFDIDECTNSSTNNCSSDATCTNIDGSYYCTCHAGYHGTGIVCEDTDECKLHTNNCSVSATCSNIIGSYNCSCIAGYQGNGFNCTDIDECATVPNICVKNDNCVNTIGSYYCNCTNRNLNIATNCSTCLPGYMRQDSQCIDMHEPCKYHGTFNLTTILCECNTNIFSSSTNCSSCAENHYSYPACLYCLPAVSCNGHGTCNSTGQCVCDAAYSSAPDCSLCGDQICSVSEDCHTCSTDCGTCPATTGKGGETTANNATTTGTTSKAITGTNTGPYGTTVTSRTTGTSGTTATSGTTGTSGTNNETTGVPTATPTTGNGGSSSTTSTSSTYICPDSCSNHGTCNQGVCYCTDTWSGPACNQVAQPTVIGMTPQPSPIIVFQKTENTTSSVPPFSIGIKELVEFHKDNVVGSLEVSNKTFTLSNYSSSQNNSMQQYKIRGTLSNGATLDVTASSWAKSTTVAFAGMNITVAAYALKYTFEFSNWPFQSPNNNSKLRAVIQSHVSGANETQSPFSVSDNDGNLLYFIVYEGEEALYCDLIPVAFLDGKPRNITASLSGSELSLTIPYFSSSAVVDPNYSILDRSPDLLGTGTTNTPSPTSTTSSHAGGSHLSRAGTISLAVLLPFFFVAALVGGVTYYKLHKKRHESVISAEMVNVNLSE